MLTQLQPPLPIFTPKGKAWAVAVIDYGPQWDLQWITFVRETGECWTFRNSQIRQEQNYTHGLPEPTPIREPQARGENEYPELGMETTDHFPLMRTPMEGVC